MKRRFKRRRHGSPGRPPLTEAEILAWADAFHERWGKWPIKKDELINGPLRETWRGVDAGLRRGLRGLPGGSSLARLLAERRGIRNRLTLPRLSLPKILAWADAHHRRTGAWPKRHSGPIRDSWGYLVGHGCRLGGRLSRASRGLLPGKAAGRSTGRAQRQSPSASIPTPNPGLGRRPLPAHGSLANNTFGAYFRDVWGNMGGHGSRFAARSSRASWGLLAGKAAGRSTGRAQRQSPSAPVAAPNLGLGRLPPHPHRNLAQAIHRSNS